MESDKGSVIWMSIKNVLLTWEDDSFSEEPSFEMLHLELQLTCYKMHTLLSATNYNSKCFKYVKGIKANYISLFS